MLEGGREGERDGGGRGGGGKRWGLISGNSLKSPGIRLDGRSGNAGVSCASFQPSYFCVTQRHGGGGDGDGGRWMARASLAIG